MKRALAFLLIVSAGCGGPEPGETPEETAEAWAKLKVREMRDEVERDLDKREAGYALTGDGVSLWASRGQFRKNMDDTKAELEFRKDNLGKMKEISYDIVDVQETSKTTRTVTVKFGEYEPIRSARNRKYYLDYKGKSRWVKLSLIEGRWRVVGEQPPEQRPG